MIYGVQLLKNNDCFKRNQYIVPKGIMVHSTGANNPYLRRYLPGNSVLGLNTYNNDWDRSGTKACVHAFIGYDLRKNVLCYQTLPWSMRGWHSASGVNGSANNTHISFEICEDDLTDPVYFKKAYSKAVELCVFLCEQYDISPENIICHSEGYKMGIASNHSDVMHWFPRHNKTMDTFRAEVKTLLIKEEEDEMSAIVQQIAKLSGKSESDVIQALAVLVKFANVKEDGWEATGVKNLLNLNLISSPRDGREPVEFGELGVILKNFKDKYTK